MDHFLTAAWQAAQMAGALIRENWQRAHAIEYKSAIDLVTATDRASEETIVAHPLVVALARHAREARGAADAARLDVAREKRALAVIDHLAEQPAKLRREMLAQFTAPAHSRPRRRRGAAPGDRLGWFMDVFTHK